MDKITVYSKHNCFPCKMTKRFLAEHGIMYTEKNIDEDLNALEYVMEKGVKQAPAIFVNDQLFATGFNPTRLKLLGGVK